jgi:hypothetical protein
MPRTCNCPEGFSRKKYQDGSNAIDFFYLGAGHKTYFFSGLKIMQKKRNRGTNNEYYTPFNEQHSDTT